MRSDCCDNDSLLVKLITILFKILFADDTILWSVIKRIQRDPLSNFID
jgi:hypothetical protein